MPHGGDKNKAIITLRKYFHPKIVTCKERVKRKKIFDFFT